MVPPDSERAKRLPTLSWTSVVDDAPGGEVPDVAAADPTPSPSAAAPLVEPVVPGAQTAADVADARPAPPVLLEPMTLSVGGDPGAPSPDVAPVAPVAQIAPVEPIAPVAPVAPTGPREPIVFEPMTITATEAGGEVPPASPPIAIRAFAPSPIVPVERALSDVTDLDDSPLPEIREATPIDPVAAEAVATGDDITLQPAESNSASVAPTLPRAAQPDQRATTPEMSGHVAEPFVTTVDRTTRTARKRSRRGLKLVVTLVVVGGLVAAAVVFGRPYLFPSDWDATTEPYALAVETARDTTFVEPLAIIAEPAEQVTERAGAEVIGASAEQLPTWRALGLTKGAVTDAAVGAALAPGAVYSTEDGQVYVADDAMGADIDAALTQAMAAAALDQELVWSSQQSERTLDDAALTAAEVLRQARDIQQASTFDGTPPGVDMSAGDALAPVLAYRALAPVLFAEFDRVSAAEAGDAGSNPLDGIEGGSPGPLASESPSAAPNAQMIESDVAVGAPAAMDRSFWYLVFAGFHDAPTAYLASEAVVESSLTTAERGKTVCAYATFAGNGTDQTAMLRGVLEGWSAAAPPEFSSSFSVLADGTLQLVSCDPGAGFDAPVRPTAARELLAWRVAEVATIEAVAADSSDVDADVDFAWPFVVGSGIVDELIALPANASPAEFAAAARASVERTLTPAG